MNIRQEIKRVLSIEASAIEAVKKRINNNFEKAVKVIFNCRGKIIISGMGKSGLAGQKIAATFSSTGTPAISLHAAEAAHGDIGVLTKGDVAIVISQSGETDEIIGIIPSLRRLKIPLIAITGNKNSTLAKNSDCVLDSSVKQEACPLDLAPTASTAVQLAIGDALAVALLKLRGFDKKDFALLHPGGALGKRLTLKVKDIMHTGREIPAVDENATLKRGLLEMTNKRLGCTAVLGKKGEIKGIFTDGDLRRLLEKSENPFSTKMKYIMSRNPRTASKNTLVIQALEVMEKYSITVLLAAGKKGGMEGIVHLHDILKSGVV